MARGPLTAVARSGAAALVVWGVAGLGLALPSQASSGPVVVKAARNPAHGSIVVDTSGRSLYLLTSEAHGQFTCNVVCAVFWPPLTVPSGTTSVSAGPGVAGRLGLIKNPEGNLQVTYNGYPLYRYLSDRSTGQTQGQGITSFGGTWYLVNAGATTTAATPVRK